MSMAKGDKIAEQYHTSVLFNLEEFQNDYGKEYQSFDDIENETTVIYYDSSEPHPELPFIIQQF